MSTLKIKINILIISNDNRYKYNVFILNKSYKAEELVDILGIFLNKTINLHKNKNFLNNYLVVDIDRLEREKIENRDSNLIIIDNINKYKNLNLKKIYQDLNVKLNLKFNNSIVKNGLNCGYKKFVSKREAIEFSLISNKKFKITKLIYNDNAKRSSFIMPMSYLKHIEIDLNEINGEKPIFYNKKEFKFNLHKEYDIKYNGIDKTSEGLLIIADKELLKSQNDIIIDCLKKFFKNIFQKGKKFSLPSKLFENRTSLQRYFDWFTNTKYIKLALKDNISNLERFKYCISFLISGFHCSPSCKKPLNPMLGETYQGKIGNFLKVYAEHIAHEPLTSQILWEADEVQIYWTLEEKFEINRNSFKGKYLGTLVFDFKNYKKIYFSLPNVNMGGLIFGKRSIFMNGNLIGYDSNNFNKTIIKFGKNSKNIDQIEGVIFKDKEIEFINIFKSLDKKLFDYKNQTILSKISGSWLDCLYFDSEIYWEIKRNIPEEYFGNNDPIPSDSRYREDLAYIKIKNYNLADFFKYKLEERQRFERKLRKKIK